MPDYLFIDGGYLRQRFKSCIKACYDADVPMWPYGMKVALERCSDTSRTKPQKVFYYDCVPDTEASQNQDASQFAEQEKLMQTIRSMHGWHVREGRLVGSRKERRSQKRVDVLLTVEMLSHAIAQNMDRAILIAGDDDFTPLVAELLRHGTYVEVWSDRTSESQFLGHSADEGHRMTLPFYWNLTPPEFQSDNPLPVERKEKMPNRGHEIRQGIARCGLEVSIVKTGKDHHFCVLEGDQLFSRLSANRLEVLDRTLTEQFEPDMLPEEWTTL